MASLDDTTPISVEGLDRWRAAIASGAAPPEAVAASAATLYVRALEEAVQQTSHDLALAATACAANALLANPEVLAPGLSDGLQASTRLMHQARPIRVYLGAAKIVHVVAATVRGLEPPNELPIAVSSTLAWCLTGAPHHQLASELLCACYALKVKHRVEVDVRPQLARLLGETALPIRRHAATVAMVYPPDEASLEPLVRLLEIMAQRYVVEGCESPPGLLAPLACLTALCKASARSRIRRLVFPPERDDRVWQAARRAPPPPPGAENDKEDDAVDRDRIHPVDAPPFALRTLLFDLMTDLDATVKRFATEFLFECCNRDEAEFALRCGYGNALAFLQLLGSSTS